MWFINVTISLTSLLAIFGYPPRISSYSFRPIAIPSSCVRRNCFFFLSFSYLANAQTLCGAGAAGFNIDPLIKADYYRIRIPEKFCSEFFPNSYSNLCNNDNLGPSSVCITNGTTGYSLGEYTENPFESISDKLVASFNNGSDKYCKEDSLITSIDFQCGPDALWDTIPGQDYGDASAYFDGIITDFLNLCSITITVYYDRICPLVACEAGSHDISQLLGPDYWQADVDPVQCNSFFGREEKCTLYLSFCQNIMGVSECASSTVCLSDGTTTYNFGQYNQYANPFLGSESNALEVIFGQGKNYSQCPSSLTSTVLILDCVPGEDWEYSGNKGNASSYLVVIEPAPGGGCMVIISMNYSGACNKSSSSAGAGWVGLGLLIGLVVIVTP